jgi:cytochrome b561
MTRPPISRTVRASIALHWLTVLLFVAAYATMEFRDVFPKGSAPREAMKSWHYTAGLSIFLVAWLRLLLRALTPSRASEAAMSRWQVLASTLTHLALYGLMIGLPLLGWLILSAEGDPIRFFGFDLPALIGPNDGLAEPFEESHEVIARVGYGLIGIHVLAALVHHYLLRDATLTKMLPARS